MTKRRPVTALRDVIGRLPLRVRLVVAMVVLLSAALLGTWFLKETFSLRRAAGTAAIVAGVMALRLG